MIVELRTACPDLGVRRVSLNFAACRAALERGGRIGAGPVARLWARLLHGASRWWQIESLYRFNAKFQPHWVSRYLVFPAARDLPLVALAALEAEGFGGRPSIVCACCAASQWHRAPTTPARSPCRGAGDRGALRSRTRPQPGDHSRSFAAQSFAEAPVLARHPARHRAVTGR